MTAYRRLNVDHHQSVDPISLEDFSRCGDMGEKMTGIKKSVWGVPFPSPKTDQIEDFYIRLLTKKLRVTVFHFVHDSPCTHTP